MKRVQVAAFDDVEWKARKELVPAEKTIRIGRDGEWRELDLSAENYAQLIEAIGPFWRAGHKEGEAEQPPRTRQYYVDLREWAEAQGRSGEAPKYKTGWKYSDALKRDYDAYLVRLAAVEQATGRSRAG